MGMKEDFQFYLDNQDNLVKKYNGTFIVIKNKEILGSYETELKAIEETIKQHELGTFIVQKCEPGDESYTQTYHSRVSFI